MQMTVAGKLFGLAMGLSLAGLGTAQAQTPEEFYKGKTINLLISADPGGSADFFGREFAKYFAKHIPGQPNITISNNGAGGGMAVALQTMNARLRDGLTVAFLQRNNFFFPVISEEHKSFDPRKVTWLGSLNKESFVLIGWNASIPHKKPDDIFTMPMKLGSTNFSNENRIIPVMMSQFFGAKFTMVNGYAGNDELSMAIERGEVNGRLVSVNNVMAGSEANWYKDGKISVLMQATLSPHPAFPNVPNILSYTKDPDVLAFANFMLAPLEAGRPFAIPEGVPADRVAALRKAFMDAAKDPEFLANMKRLNSGVDPITGQQVEAIIDSLYKTPAPVLEKIKALVFAPNPK